MPSPANPLLEAEEKLDAGDYAGARDAYREALLREPPTTTELSLLSTAEDWECVEYRHALCEKHPNSRDARKALAHAYLRIGRPQQAVAIFNTLIEEEGPPRHRIPLLIARFRAAVSAGKHHLATSDFVEIWLAGKTIRPARRFRPGLLNHIHQAPNSAVERILDGIAPQLPKEIHLMKYIRIKKRELAALAAASGLQG
ncbi:tetratricopeptide repeat protein [Hyalangium gracile]|uniref:tetratricopeptide repeat protein n=1 Tax=Hyalangium gracile TaxID=394092 RepID=UPI001CCF8DE7|nr:hypothetical protein [Hyalangium gracile]